MAAIWAGVTSAPCSHGTGRHLAALTWKYATHAVVVNGRRIPGKRLALPCRPLAKTLGRKILCIAKLIGMIAPLGILNDEGNGRTEAARSPPVRRGDCRS